jgi:hypothetical protein
MFEWVIISAKVTTVPRESWLGRKKPIFFHAFVHDSKLE